MSNINKNSHCVKSVLIKIEHTKRSKNTVFNTKKYIKIVLNSTAAENEKMLAVIHPPPRSETSRPLMSYWPGSSFQVHLGSDEISGTKHQFTRNNKQIWVFFQ